MATVITRSFTEFTDTLGGLINIAWASIPSAQQTSIRQFYNNNAGYGWILNNWLPLCPNGEARFVGNQGFYPNDLSNTTYWTTTGLTPTATAIANPADGRVTATKLLELGPATAHNALQTFTYIPSTSYQVTAYFRPIGGRYLYLSANDGVNTYYAFVSPLGVLGSYSTNMTAPPTVQQTSNGFWIVNLFFTSASTAGTGNYGPGISSDGSTLTYAGDTAKGIYAWGNVLTQTQFASPTTMLIPNDQLGEEFIDSTFQVWQTSPVGPGNPVPISFSVMPDGVQILGTTGWVWNGWLWTFPSWFLAGYPVYLYYRKGSPDYSGSDYSAGTAYTVGQQILFTNSNSEMNFWKCVVATSAGQSPDTNPTKWQVLELPDILFWYVVYSSYADYLRMDAQMEKAAMADSLAQEYINTQSDKQERQQGVELPFRVQTHQTQSARGYFRV